MKDKEKLIKDYIKKVVSEIKIIVPLIILHQIRWQSDNLNISNGWISIKYIPGSFDAEFLVYSSIFKEMPEKGITEPYKSFIKYGLCHEVGNVYTWELEGTHRDLEKISSQIGFLIMQILDNKGI